MASPYDVLGVDDDADSGELVRAYRRRVKETHPDRGGSTEAFKAVQDAYETIRSGAAAGDIDAAATEGGSAGPPSPGARNSAARSRAKRNGANGGATAEPADPVTHRVTYLDYEVLDDYGWTVDDADLFEKASATSLPPDAYGRLLVKHDESLLEAAENRGYSWPFACRGGACANCAVAVVDGEVEMPANHVLSEELLERGIRLSCIATPVTDDLNLLYNIRHLPELEELRLPPQQFDR